MKKSVFLFIGIIFLIKSEAQVININSAFKYQREGKLDRAKTAIDEACVNEETKNKAKAWFYKGCIYYDINSSTNPKFKSLDSNALEVAYNSFMTALKLDEQEKKYTTELSANLNNCGIAFYNDAVREYNQKKYEKAVSSFSKVIDIKKSTATVDSVYYYSLLFAGAAAQNSGNPEIKVKAKEYLNKLVELQYKKATVYTSLANIYLAEKDTALALKTIQTGRASIGNSIELLIAEASLYIMKKQYKEAQELLKVAQEKEPNNYAIYYAAGNVYLKLLDRLVYNTDTLTYQKYYAETEKNLKKAIEIKSDFSDSYYDLGTLYLNEGVRLFTEANNLKLGDKKYDILNAKKDVCWKDATVQLEKYSELNPNDKNILLNLKQLYIKTNQMDKVKLINEKLNTK
ncbi:MAG: hypothetical protein PHD97_11725 [Bacteroidales bacterium]|nr:hypothetical protein [Bacteroidales bacterium]